MKHSVFAALTVGAFVGLGIQWAMAQPVDPLNPRVRSLTATSTVKTNILDAGAGYVANNLGVGKTLYAACVDAGQMYVANDTTIAGVTRVQALDAGVIFAGGPIRSASGYFIGGQFCDPASGWAAGACSGVLLASNDIYFTIAGTAYAKMHSADNSFRANIVDAGQLFVANQTTLAGAVRISATATSNSCTLGGETPSVCPAQTVTAGTKCTCSNVGTTAAIAALGCAVSLSGTTLTVTSANGATHVVNYHCF